MQCHERSERRGGYGSCLDAGLFEAERDCEDRFVLSSSLRGAAVGGGDSVPAEMPTSSTGASSMDGGLPTQRNEARL